MITTTTIPTLILLAALWLGPDRAIVRWSQGSGLHCLYRQNTAGQAYLVQCSQQTGDHALRLIGGDANLHPTAGDVYVLLRPDGSYEKVALKSLIYLPRL